MEIIALIIVSIMCILFGYTTINMLRKLETYEDYIDSEIKNNETLLETLRKLDANKMFEKDDEVGTLFDMVKQTIFRFKQFKNAQEKTT